MRAEIAPFESNDMAATLKENEWSVASVALKVQVLEEEQSLLKVCKPRNEIFTVKEKNIRYSK